MINTRKKIIILNTNIFTEIGVPNFKKLIMIVRSSFEIEPPFGDVLRGGSFGVGVLAPIYLGDRWVLNRNSFLFSKPLHGGVVFFLCMCSIAH